MQEKSEPIEITAPNLDDAISQGLKQLGLRKDQVEIDVLDEGSKGLFGIGARYATVRLIPLVQPTPLQAAEESKPTPPAPKPTPSPVAEPEAAVSPSAETPGSGIEDEDENPTEETGLPDEDINEDKILAVTQSTISELLEKMKVKASVKTRIDKKDRSRRRTTVIADIQGEDLSVLIGKRSETLNALQFITRLIVGKSISQSINLVIDIGGFRDRREQQLRQLARRMARQAIETGKRQVLEPMPPNERRIIHLELRDNENVTTESTGEGERRKVTITPK